MKRILAFCFGFVVCINAAANTFGNGSDAWYAPEEAGWGALMVQQQSTIFLALFVYGPDRQPTWYSAALIFDSPSQTYTGLLLVTTGPYFAEPFSAGPLGPPTIVTITPVGSVTLVAVDSDHAILTYNVGAQVVTKLIERLTYALNQLGGLYYGGFVGQTFNCNPSSSNGFLSLIANMTITHNDSQLSVAGDFQNNRGGLGSCAFAATYDQSGHVGRANGNFICTTGEVGTFTLTRLEASIDGFLAAASFHSNACSFTGRFGAIKTD